MIIENQTYDLVADLVAVFADSAEGRLRAAACVDAAGGRVGLATAIASAAEELDQQPATDVVIVDLVGDGGRALDALLERLSRAAEAGCHPSIVSFPSSLIDIVAARGMHHDVVLLCDPDPMALAGALGVALASHRQAVTPMLREQGGQPPIQLRQLSEDVARIARALAALSGVDQGGAPPLLAERPGAAPVEMPPVGAVRALLRARRLRDQFFDPELFADPAWDMLLDLLIARIEHRHVAVSSLCIAAAVPPTTALRWIKRLTDEGVFVRTADPRDGRRVFIGLSDDAANGLATYFQNLERIGIDFA